MSCSNPEYINEEETEAQNNSGQDTSFTQVNTEESGKSEEDETQELADVHSNDEDEDLSEPLISNKPSIKHTSETLKFECSDENPKFTKEENPATHNTEIKIELDEDFDAEEVDIKTTQEGWDNNREMGNPKTECKMQQTSDTNPTPQQKKQVLEETEAQYNSGQDSSEDTTDEGDESEQRDSQKYSHMYSNDEVKLLSELQYSKEPSSKQVLQSEDFESSGFPSDKNPKYTKVEGRPIDLHGDDDTAINIPSKDEELTDQQGLDVISSDKSDGEVIDIETPQEGRDYVPVLNTTYTEYEIKQMTNNSSGDIDRKEQIPSEEDYNQYEELGYEEAKKKYTYFWKGHDIFSQWYPSTFTVGSNTFTCAEQYMMFQKATLFDSDDIADKVLTTDNPSTMKALGRRVVKFKENTWIWHCLGIVRDASMHKFSQNPEMKEALFKTHPTILVEASPYDKIWGIGFRENDEQAWNESTWNGMNLLGFILTEVRDELMFKDGSIRKEDRKMCLSDLLDKWHKEIEEMYPDSLDERKDESYSFCCTQ